MVQSGSLCLTEGCVRAKGVIMAHDKRTGKIITGNIEV